MTMAGTELPPIFVDQSAICLPEDAPNGSPPNWVNPSAWPPKYKSTAFISTTTTGPEPTPPNWGWNG